MLFDGGCIFLKCWEALFGQVPDDGSRWSGFNLSHLLRFGRIHSLYHVASDIKRSRSPYDHLGGSFSPLRTRWSRNQVGSRKVSTPYNAMRQIFLPPSRHLN
jgi:hypothetical protein